MVTNQEETEEGNKVNFDLPPKFDEYEDEKKEIRKEKKEGLEREGADELKQKDVEYNLQQENKQLDSLHACDKPLKKVFCHVLVKSKIQKTKSS